MRSFNSLCLDHLDLQAFEDTGRKAHKIEVWPFDSMQQVLPRCLCKTMHPLRFNLNCHSGTRRT